MSDWFFALGHVSKSELINTGTALRNFPLQSDMTGGRVWVHRPANGAEIVTHATYVDSLSGHRYAYGGFEFEYKLWSLSPKMVKYIKDTYFPNGYSSEMTVMLHSRSTGDWEAYNVIAKYPNIREESSMAAGGLSEFTLVFTNGSLASNGPDLGLSVSDSEDWEETVTSSISIDVTNEGDDSTFDDAIVNVTLHEKTDLDGTTATNWNIEYSTDGTNYSSTPPGTLSDTTHLRYSRSDILASGNTYDTITINLISNATGSATITTSVSTTGDTNSGNNTNVLNITII